MHNVLSDISEDVNRTLELLIHYTSSTSVASSGGELHSHLVNLFNLQLYLFEERVDSCFDEEAEAKEKASMQRRRIQANLQKNRCERMRRYSRCKHKHSLCK